MLLLTPRMLLLVLLLLPLLAQGSASADGHNEIVELYTKATEAFNSGDLATAETIFASVRKRIGGIRGEGESGNFGLLNRPVSRPASQQAARAAGSLAWG